MKILSPRSISNLLGTTTEPHTLNIGNSNNSGVPSSVSITGDSCLYLFSEDPVLNTNHQEEAALQAFISIPLTSSVVRYNDSSEAGLIFTPSMSPIVNESYIVSLINVSVYDSSWKQSSIEFSAYKPKFVHSGDRLFTYSHGASSGASGNIDNINTPNNNTNGHFIRGSIYGNVSYDVNMVGHCAYLASSVSYYTGSTYGDKYYTQTNFIVFGETKEVDVFYVRKKNTTGNTHVGNKGALNIRISALVGQSWVDIINVTEPYNGIINTVLKLPATTARVFRVRTRYTAAKGNTNLFAENFMLGKLDGIGNFYSDKPIVKALVLSNARGRHNNTNNVLLNSPAVSVNLANINFSISGADVKRINVEPLTVKLSFSNL